MRRLLLGLGIVAVLTSCQNELDNYVPENDVNISVNDGEFNVAEDKGEFGFNIEVVDSEWVVIDAEL
jgi:Prokaryotic membrane lipoprotein lipid attachment site